MKKIVILIVILLGVFLCSCSNNEINHQNNSQNKETSTYSNDAQNKKEITYEEEILGTWIYYCEDSSLNFANTFFEDGTVNYYNRKGKDITGKYTIDENTIVIDDAEFEYRFIEDKLEMSINNSTVLLVRGKKNDVFENKHSSTSTSSQQTKDGFTLENATKVTDNNLLAKCWTVATEEVKSNLKSPSSAKFPFSAISDGVEILKDRNYYCVYGWVDAENSFGAKIRSEFVVLIEEKNGQFIAYDCTIE